MRDVEKMEGEEVEQSQVIPDRLSEKVRKTRRRERYERMTARLKGGAAAFLAAAFLFAAVVSFFPEKASAGVPTFRPVDLWVERIWLALRIQREYYVKFVLTNISGIEGIASLSALKAQLDQVQEIFDQLESTLEDVTATIKGAGGTGLMTEVMSGTSVADLAGILENGEGFGFSDESKNLRKLYESGEYVPASQQILQRYSKAFEERLDGTSGGEGDVWSRLASLFSSKSKSDVGSGGGGSEKGAKEAARFVKATVPLSLPKASRAAATILYDDIADDMDRRHGINTLREEAKVHPLAQSAAVAAWYREGDEEGAGPSVSGLKQDDFRGTLKTFVDDAKKIADEAAKDVAGYGDEDAMAVMAKNAGVYVRMQAHLMRQMEFSSRTEADRVRILAIASAVQSEGNSQELVKSLKEKVMTMEQARTDETKRDMGAVKGSEEAKP